MHGHTLRTGDAPNDVVHVDMKGHTCTCTDDELEALAAYFRALREKGEKRLTEPPTAASPSPAGTHEVNR